MRKRKKTHVGLDIGSHSLKIIEVLAGQGTPIIKNVGVYELPAGSLEEVLPKGLKSLLDNTAIDTKEVNISISGSGVVVRFIELPFMQDSELSQAITYEAEKYIPFDIKDIILDYTVLDRSEADKKMKILLVGAKRDFVEKRIKLLEEAGLAPIIIDIDSFAIFNAFTKSIPKDKRNNKTIALLNIGAHLTNIVIVSGDLPSMVRDINLGGANMTQILQDNLNIDNERAERLKQEPAGKEDKVLTLLKGVLQKLVDEIRNSFTYYENQYGRGIDEVYVSGGSIKLEGLIPFLKESIDLEFIQWDPLTPFVKDPSITDEILEKFKPSLAVCSGLALRI